MGRKWFAHEILGFEIIIWKHAFYENGVLKSQLSSSLGFPKIKLPHYEPPAALVGP
jgi:hypothetical protein|tara:strand:- start:3581 stop:3748 length:168 start_codon:yes stop_codon:yes gene_type:complete